MTLEAGTGGVGDLCCQLDKFSFNIDQLYINIASAENEYPVLILNFLVAH